MDGAVGGQPRHEDERRLALLIADDDAHARSLLDAVVRTRVGELDVLHADDGAEAVQIALRQRPQIALQWRS